MRISEQIDELTSTFELDRSYCNQLFQSIHAETVAELVLYHLWIINAGPICQRALAKVANLHFLAPRQSELGTTFTLLLLEGMKREMCLIPYLAIRGLPSEAGMPLRRALDYAGVLTHIWRDPPKLKAAKGVAGFDFWASFKKALDVSSENTLKALGITDRFESMKEGRAIQEAYHALGGLDVIETGGEASERYDAKPDGTRCGFCLRAELGTDLLTQRLGILLGGHKLLCAELMYLAIDFCGRSDEVRNVSKAFQFVANNTETEIQRLLAQLRGVPAILPTHTRSPGNGQRGRFGRAEGPHSDRPRD